MRLVSCERCARHVRVAERSCPFCGVARVALGAIAIGAVVAGCGGAPAAGETTPPPNEAPAEQTTNDQGGDETNDDDDDTPRERDATPVAAYGGPSPQ
ncbi:hypothetical protein [Sandaracinus amylolyticus]|uniref:hypothetical protein n=1 Tax=Sandaracinus amylolyticus TaxID=927083 RepID=UPI001F29F8B1|nr:hypothetical protein [Sandaracinus amylolyticus]UJR84507.1 Hypothetical protein I5071_65860 [Sandaracinus amylolyticus]